MLKHFQTGVSVNKKKLTKMFVASVLSVSIAACSTQSAPSADISSNVTLSASRYLEYAQKTSGQEKVDWQIMATRAMIKQKQYSQAQALLDNLKVQNLTQFEMTQIQLAQARLYYKSESIKEATLELDKIILVNIALKQAAQYLELRALVGEYESRYVYAANQRLKRDAYLGQDAKQANWQRVWDDLSALPVQNYIDALSDTPILSQWLEIIQLHKKLSYRPSRLQEAQRLWLQEHPSHPANLYPSQQMLDVDTFSSENPKRVALLLPLTGGAAELGDAVRDGFMTQMFNDLKENTHIELYVHNTNANPMDMLYQDVQKEKADMIVGPLLKSSVQDLIAVNDAQLPVLSLNIPANMQVDTNNVCFYSLSPEQEAEHTAIRMFEEGKKHPVVFTTKKSINNRMANAFVAKWAELSNGSVVEIKEFSDVAELQKKIPQAFDKKRIAELEEALNLEENKKKKLSRAERANAVKRAQAALEKLPDVVYLLGQQSDLILAKPFIEVAANPALTNVEFYTSSYSYDKSSDKFTELNGLVFSVMPMFVASDDTEISTKDERLKSYTTQLSRLYAMGRDAYKISNNLNQLKSDTEHSLDGLTGTLSIGEQCVMQRELTWARYTNNGIEIILPDTQGEDEAQTVTIESETEKE